MAPRAGVAAHALLVLTAFIGTASSMPFKRFANSTTKPYSNSTQQYTSILVTGSSDPTSLITTDSITSTYLSTDPQPSDPQSIDPQPTESSIDDPVDPETSVVVVTQTVDPVGNVPESTLTSEVFVTTEVDITVDSPIKPTPSEVLLTSVLTIEPTGDSPGTFVVLRTSTKTVFSTELIQPSATMTSTLEPSSAPSGTPVTSVTVVTELETVGVVTSQPIPTENSVTSSVTPSALSRPGSVQRVSNTTATGSIDPFAPIATNSPPSQISATGNHPVPTNNIVATKNPLHTNKFYANLFLGSESSSVFTHPYSVSWANGSGSTSSFGLAIQHVEASQRAFGPNNTKLPGSPASYFINPLGFQTLVMSAKELGKGTQLTADSLDTFSVNANLLPSAGSSSSIKFPLVQGMGFVTGIYTSLQPQIQSGAFFSSVSALGNIGSNTYKWRLSLNDGSSWLMYAMPLPNANGATFSPTFTLVNNGLFQGPTGFSGVIQISKNPTGSSGETVYDKGAGIYPMSAQITGVVNGKVGQYSLTWAVGGKNGTGRHLVQYALPHHIQSFTNATMANVQKNMTLQTTTKGVATAVFADSWTMTESTLPIDMGFAPWSPLNGTKKTYSSQSVNAIYKAAQVELQQNISGQTNTDSMYFSGKALSKFASIVYAVNNICNEPNLAKQGLQALESAINVFTSNKQQHPLVYDTVWKGVVSSASYNGGDALADFGNTYYNDHHFHYGYFLHAAAVIGSLDSTWLAANKDWVNALARDVNNPSQKDSFFPVFRNFDWYHGHSWAKGLFESGDSKDEESSSEDVMFSYGLKMWGNVVGDKAMEARGNLMLAVQARSLHNYFLMEDDNTNQPAQIIANKATGILFENKVDHTTYFGTNLEYIQGIHMLPLVPASALTRRSQFVQQEWNAFFKSGAVDDANNVTGGWKGILFANLALIDPVSSFKFFNQDNFDNSWLDGGASRTWYLAFAAGLGGA